MKIGWKLLTAFYMPLHFAFGSFYVSDWLLGGKSDCRNTCLVMMNCADSDILMLFDFFVYSGIGLVLLSIVLPIIILSRNKELQQFKLLK